MTPLTDAELAALNAAREGEFIRWPMLDGVLFPEYEFAELIPLIQRGNEMRAASAAETEDDNENL